MWRLISSRGEVGTSVEWVTREVMGSCLPRSGIVGAHSSAPALPATRAAGALLRAPTFCLRRAGHFVGDVRDLEVVQVARRIRFPVVAERSLGPRPEVAVAAAQPLAGGAAAAQL